MYIVNLYKIKWNQKYTQEDIVKATNLSVGTVNNLFSGKYHDYKLSTLETICKFFNCDISEILVKVPDNN